MAARKRQAKPIDPASVPPKPKQKRILSEMTDFEKDIMAAIVNSDCYCKPGDPTCEDWTDSDERWRAIFEGVMRVINQKPEDSNLIKHAKLELELLGEDAETVEGYLEIFRAWGRMGHSGGSASIAIPVINALLLGRNLTPLTDDPDEWIQHDESVWGAPGGVYQNKRNGEAFSTDGGKTYYLLSEGAHAHNQRPLHNSQHKEIPNG